MSNFLNRPFKLYNSIQHYEWGTKNENAFIPNLIGINAEKDKPYAELWIGAHPKAPSEIEINGKKTDLNKIIGNYSLEILGDYVIKKFNGKFPFLLKVLSAAEALSIQTHPNKQKAEILHAKDPVNYPDNNHKPEIAIALDSLTAVAGFKPVDEIVNNLKSLPELSVIVGEELLNKTISESNAKLNKYKVQELYSVILKNADNKVLLDKCIGEILIRLNNKKKLTPEENQFVLQYNRYGVDVGLLSFFFFNLIELKSKQAIFTDAGIPHAYLRGNIIECMANSDNVVRAGLTEKYKDVETLLDLIKFDFEKYDILNSEMHDDYVTYKTSAEEFLISAFYKKTNFEMSCKTNNRPSVYLITEGRISVTGNFTDPNVNYEFFKGDSFLIPAIVDKYKISIFPETTFFSVQIP